MHTKIGILIIETPFAPTMVDFGKIVRGIRSASIPDMPITGSRVKDIVPNMRIPTPTIRDIGSMLRKPTESL